MRKITLLYFLLIATVAMAQNSDYVTLNTEKIKNPMLWADVPDPDIIRVGDTFYLVSTTMHLMPGAPVMASKDLKNWETVGYIFDRLTDSPKYDLQQGTVYGRGQWATSLKYHNGKFYALLAPNEHGKMGDTYIFSAEKAEGPWKIVSRMRHFHDCSLFFDDDGRVFVVYGTGEAVIKSNAELLHEYHFGYFCGLKSRLGGIGIGADESAGTEECASEVSGDYKADILQCGTRKNLQYRSPCRTGRLSVIRGMDYVRGASGSPYDVCAAMMLGIMVFFPFGAQKSLRFICRRYGLNYTDEL